MDLFIFLSLFVLIGFPILTYALFSIAAIAEGHDVSYGIAYANNLVHKLDDARMSYIGILFISLLIYIIQIIRDIIIKTKKDKNIFALKQNTDTSKTVYPAHPIFNSNINIFDLRIGDMIADTVYGAGIIVDIYKLENDLFFTVNFTSCGKMTFNPCYRRLAKIQYSSLNGNPSQAQQFNNVASDTRPMSKVNYKKANLLTDNEQNIYKTIRLIAEKYNFTVLSKVRLADIAKVNPALDNVEWWSNFGKVKSKHIDFALAKKENLDVVLVIELDDSTHLKRDRIERDAFVDSVFNEIGIPILHVYNAVDLENKIISALDLSLI